MAEGQASFSSRQTEFTGRWTIDSFRTLTEPKIQLNFQTNFLGLGANSERWAIQIEPHCTHKDLTDEEQGKFVGFWLICDQFGDAEEVRAVKQISVISRAGSVFKKTNDQKKEITFAVGSGRGWGYWKMVERSKLEGVLLDFDGGLAVQVWLKPAREYIIKPMFPIPEDTWTDDMYKLYRDQTHCDLTLRVGGREFPVHRAILSARAPGLLRAVMPANSPEPNSPRGPGTSRKSLQQAPAACNVIQVKDADEEIFERILEYIYTGRCSSLEEHAASIFNLANTYGLTRVQLMAGNSLLTQLTVPNVTRVMALMEAEGIMSGAAHVREKLFRFVRDHTRAVMETQGWRELTNKYPHLANDFTLWIVERTDGRKPAAVSNNSTSSAV